jgi:hypothetical protein
MVTSGRSSRRASRNVRGAAAPHYLASIEKQFAGGLTDAELGSIAEALRKVLQQPMTLGPHGPRR